MKVGINLHINLSKIDKSRLFKGKNGYYLSATVFVDVDNKDKYDNNGMIVMSKNKGETGKTPILGNCKVFCTDVESAHQSLSNDKPNFNQVEFVDDVPF